MEYLIPAGLLFVAAAVLLSGLSVKKRASALLRACEEKERELTERQGELETVEARRQSVSQQLWRSANVVYLYAALAEEARGAAPEELAVIKEESRRIMEMLSPRDNGDNVTEGTV